MRSYYENIKLFGLDLRFKKYWFRCFINLWWYDDRYIKTKIRTYGDKVYTNLCGLNVPGDDIECKSFTVISINYLLVYKNKYYLEVYLDNGPYKTAIKQMTDYLHDGLLED